MFSLFLEAAGQVALAAILLGVGLPTLFAVGVRSFIVAGAEGTPSVDGATIESSRIPAPVLRTIGTLCFALVIAAVAIGLTIIIATGFGQELSFVNFVPTLVPKD